MHVRQSIREAVKTTLTGINIDANQGAVTVYANRARPVDPANLPAIRIHTLIESSELETMTTLQRELTVVVEVLTADQDSALATLDDYAVEVEKALAADRTLGGKVRRLHLSSTGLEMEPAHGIRQLALTYTAHYSTTPAAPDVAS